MFILYVLAWLWALPQELFGILWALAVCRPRAARIYKGALELTVGWLPMGASGETFGMVRLYVADAPSPALRAHEETHTIQSWILGPLWGPFYGIACIVAELGGGNFYFDNAFERWARARAARLFPPGV